MATTQSDPEPGTTAGTRQLGHRSMEHEVRVDSLPVRGEVPRWLTGAVVRATPAKLDIGDRSVGHWFDGLGMLNVFGFDDGRVSYGNRFFRTRSHESAQRGRYEPAISIATDPCRRLGQRVSALFDPSLVAEPHVNVSRLGGRYLAATEVACPLEFDPDTLETLGFRPIRDSVREFHATYSHPQFDAERGEMIACATRVGLRNRHRIVALGPDLERREIGGAPASRQPEYMHSFAMTEHYVVLVLQPLTYTLPAIARSGRYTDGFRWHPERGTRFVTIDRRTGRVHGEHHTDAFFFWHTVNAYEDGDELTVDLVAAPDPQSVWDLELDKLRDPDHRPAFHGELRRYRMPLAGGPAVGEALSELRMEFPRIDDRRSSREYRHVYAVAYRGPDSDWFDQLVKVDTTTGHTSSWCEDGCYPSEPNFAAAPDSTGDDDGVIIDIVLDTRAERSFLLVLDAADFTEIARAELPHHLPFSFHGQYFD